MLVVDLYDAGFWVFMRTGEEGLKGGGELRSGEGGGPWAGGFSTGGAIEL